jgi:hypothetical protein
MSSRPHRRPAPWRGSSRLDLDEGLGRDLESLLDALASHAEARLPAGWIPRLRARVHEVLEHGHGALKHDSAVLQDLPKAEFDRLFVELCGTLGWPVPINREGEVLREVKDAGARDSALAPRRGHLTNQELLFHSDRADLTVLGCWSPAPVGGLFRVCSSAWIAHEIERRSAPLAAQLKAPIPHDLRDEGSPHEGYAELPIWTEDSVTFVFRYIRKFNESVVRHGVTLDPAVTNALDEIDHLLADPGLAAELPFQRGTVVMVNNHTTLHARTAFEDSAAQQRCLLRCWLASEYTRRLPDSFLPIFHAVQPGSLRGGVLATTARAARRDPEGSHG